jgi:1-acyl-sn-glycerol-3-phosphate acyltransferase
VTRVRTEFNRIVLVPALVVVLPAVAIAERIRAGAGRRLLVHAIRALGAAMGVRFEVAGGPLGAGPHVFVPNHSSPLDIPAVLVACPGSRFLAAAGLFRVPLLSSAMRALGTIPVDRADQRRSHAEIDAVAGGPAPGDLVVFAEGGIRRGALGPFKSGAFRIAIATGMSVVPVTIRGSATALAAGGRLRIRPATVVVQLGDPIPTFGLRPDDRHQLRDRTRDAIERALGAITTPTVGAAARPPTAPARRATSAPA